MSSRRRAVVGVGALVVIVAAGWWWTRGRDRGDSTGQEERSAGSGGRTGGARMRSRPLPARAWQLLDLDARRVAGTVTYRGAPVAGATVRLELDVRLRGAVSLEELTTGADGRFDFGPRVAGETRVSASAPDRAPAGVLLDLRDPTLAPPPDELILALTDCDRTAEGTVRDAGGPIAGATVRAGSETTLAVASATTDTSGAYRMCTPAGTLSMSAHADGYARVADRVDGGRRVRKDFELLPEVTIGGVVMGPDDRPVAGALVTAQLLGERSWRDSPPRVVTGDDGRFGLAGVPPGRYGLAARAAGMSSGQPVDAVARVGDPPADAVLRLQPLVVVRGRVLEDGKPVPGAVVAVSRRWTSLDDDAAEMADLIDAVTRPDGAFVLDGVAPGAFEIVVRQYELLSAKQQTAVLPETEVTLEVASMASIAGRVTRGGQGVARADVRLEGGTDRFGGHVATQADGTFVLRGIDPGSYKVTAQNDTAFSRGVSVVVAKGQHVEGVAIELDLAGEVSGVVVDQRSAPVGGVFVSFSLRKGNDWGRAITEEDGSFVAGAMSGGGDYDVVVRPSSESNDSLPPAAGGAFPPVAVADGQTRVTGLRLAIRLDRGDISGVVVHDDGTPAVDVVVSASSSWRDDGPGAVTDGAGRFALRGLMGGPFRIEARTGTGLEASARRIALGRSDLRLVLPVAGAIEATVTGFGPGVTVTAASYGAGSFRAALEEGRFFRVRNVPPGHYSVIAREGEAFDSVDVQVNPGRTSTVKLATEGMATVNARVIDAATRAAVAGAYCSMSRSRGKSASTDRSGRFTMSVPARRDVGLTCYGRGGGREQGDASVHLEPGATSDLVIEIKPREPPKPRPPVDLGMTLEGTPPNVASVTPGGAAERAGLRAGDTLVSVDGSECDTFSADLTRTLIAGNEIGDKVKLVILRGGNRLEVELEIVAG